MSRSISCALTDSAPNHRLPPLAPSRGGTEKSWQVYIIQAESGKLYTGISNDLARRWKEHGSGRKGARFFHFSSPHSLLFSEWQSGRSEASKREIAIKRMSRQEKLALIASVNRENEEI